MRRCSSATTLIQRLAGLQRRADLAGEPAQSARHVAGQRRQSAVERHAGAGQGRDLVAERGELIERDGPGDKRER